MSKTYNFAIVGLGNMGNWHRDLLCNTGDWHQSTVNTKFENIRLKGSFDINPERRQFAAEKGLLAYDSFEAVLADPEIDVIVCATPNDSHKDIVIRTLRAGKCAVTEKPATLCSADLAEMTAAAKETGKLFTVHHNRRWDEDFLTVKRLCETGDLGGVYHIESRIHVPGGVGLPDKWRGLPEKGGGQILDWGVHLFDQLLLMVHGKLRRVFATCTHITNELVEDGFTAHFEFESGMTALVEVGSTNFIPLPRFHVLGLEGSATIPLWKREGTVTRISGWDGTGAIPVRGSAGRTIAPRAKPELIKTEPLVFESSDVRDFYRNVVAAIEGREAPFVKLPEVARVLRLIETVKESARAKRVIEFE